MFPLNYLVFLVLFAFSTGGLVDFMDCGSESLHVDQIDIPGCDQSPCRLTRGVDYHFYVVPDYLHPEVDDIEVEAYVALWGALFNVNATSVNPCVTSCPLTSHVTRPQLDFLVNFPTNLQRFPATLYLRTTYKDKGVRKSRFCVATDVRLQ